MWVQSFRWQVRSLEVVPLGRPQLHPVRAVDPGHLVDRQTDIVVPVAPMSDLVRVELLDGSVTGIGLEGDRRQTDQVAVATTMAILAMHPNEVVSYAHLARLLGTNHVASNGHAPGDLTQRISRAAAVYGAKIGNQRGQGYKLFLEPTQVDAQVLLSTSQLIRRGSPPDGDSVEMALALWGQGPPEFLLTPRMADQFGSLADAHALLLGQRRKRVLIVDDHVGERIAAMLSDCVCEVAHSLDEFRIWEPRLSEFDLVLVDVHLTNSYTDHDGLAVMHSVVSSNSDVPILGMTSNPGGSREISANDWTVKHDLVDFVFKRGDDVGDDLSPVAEKARLALREGSEILIGRLIERLPNLVRKAELIAKYTQHPKQIAKIREQAGQIVELMLSDSRCLGDVRVAIDRFRRDWKVDFDPGLDR